VEGRSSDRLALSKERHVNSSSESLLAPTETRPRTRLQHNILKPKVFMNGTMRYDKLDMIATREPNTLNEVLSDSNWKSAMDEEFSALVKNKT
jgi:hypothetical protein